MTAATALVPVFTGILADRTTQLCDARTLHTFMQVKRDFSNWIKGRIRKFGFVANEDYLLAKSGEQVPHQGGIRTVERIDYHLTLDMAKELAMVENNEQGRAARRYFIECERRAIEAMSTTRYSVNPGDVLPKAEADELRAFLETAAQKLPLEKRGGFLAAGWSKLRKHTGVNYRKMPAAAVTDALSLLARHAAEWELVDESPKLGHQKTVPEIVAEWVEKIEQPNGYPAFLFLPLVDAVNRKMKRRMVELPPGKTIVDVRKLAAIWVDLGKLKSRVDGLGCLESDLPPSWWEQHAISAQ